jgi:hypothetical protein
MAFPAGTDISVALRVDDVTLTPDRDGEACITQAMYRGDSYLYEVLLPSGQCIRAQSLHTRHYTPGTKVRVGLTPGHSLAYFPVII